MIETVLSITEMMFLIIENDGVDGNVALGGNSNDDCDDGNDSCDGNYVLDDRNDVLMMEVMLVLTEMVMMMIELMVIMEDSVGEGNERGNAGD